MKRAMFLFIIVLFVQYLYGQNSVNVEIVYDKITQKVIIDITNNCNDTTFVIYNKSPQIHEIEGSLVRVSKTKETPLIRCFEYEEIFPLFEYDKLTEEYKDCPFMIHLLPRETRSYAINIKDRKHLKDCMEIYVYVYLRISRVEINGKREYLRSGKEFEQYIMIE